MLFASATVPLVVVSVLMDTGGRECMECCKETFVCVGTSAEQTRLQNVYITNTRGGEEYSDD